MGSDEQIKNVSNDSEKEIERGRCKLSMLLHHQNKSKSDPSVDKTSV